MMNFYVVRLSTPDGNIKTFDYDPGSPPPTVADVLSRAGYTLAAGERPFIDGEPVSLNSTIPARNASLSIVQTASNGK